MTDGKGKDGVDRRTWMKQVGVGVSSATILGAAACGDDTGSEAAPDTGTDAGTDTRADAAADGGGTDSGGQDTGIAPEPSLQPLRGDGSHAFDYIDTIVIVQMENRSFDHYFGALSLHEGRTDVDGLVAGVTNPSIDGSAVAAAALGESWEIWPDPHHGHGSSVTQFNGGANDGFVRDWEPSLSDEERAEKLGWTMGYYERERLAPLYSLADQFTLCDRWFCSLLGPTWPNRFYSHCATSDGQWGNDNPIEAPTMYSRLPDAGLTFGVYHSYIAYFHLLLLDNPIDSYPSETIEQFYIDAAAGRLPNVTIVEPDYTFNDDHPPQDIRQGQAFIGSVYEALRNSPQWDRCMMVVFYDEHGGFHDHVAPEVAEGEERAEEGFAQRGFRVPGLVISPLARRGAVMHDVVEHCSVPRLIADVFGLEHLNARSANAGDLGAALDLELIVDANRPAPQALPTVDLSMRKIQRDMQRPCPHVELMEFARRRFGITPPTFSDHMRSVERWLEQVERQRIARVGS